MRVRIALVWIVVLLGSCATTTPQPPQTPPLPAQQPTATPAQAGELGSFLLLPALHGPRGAERADIQMQTTRWERTPHVLQTFTTPLTIQSTPHRLTLAGDPSGAQPFSIDNFILLEVLDENGQRTASAVVGGVVDTTGPVLLDGAPVKQIGPNAFKIPGGAADLSDFLPVGRPFILRATALDYGGGVALSDVYLVATP
jgi:hypothetical protein